MKIKPEVDMEFWCSVSILQETPEDERLVC